MNDESGESMEPKEDVPHRTICVCAQDPPLSEPSDFSSEPPDYFSTSQPTTSEGGQSVLFFNPRETIATFTRATLC